MEILKMAVTYRKATSIEELVKAIHGMDIEYVREYGTSLVVPLLDKKTKKIIVKELKIMKIYHKVNIIETNSPKKLYEIFSDKGGKFENR
ncbi:hypothetical protein [Thomasclavelia cocleata]|uniref:hypothetical protein n=2 Tax=Thomasclavelia cocleata TaxID=69824 RepID=UPI0025B74FDD|nr:hypothetical protein [Thomasclavelia cocleata]